MYTKLSFLILCLTFLSCKAQETTLISQTKVEDYSEFPVYKIITEEVDGQRVYKDEYEYVNNIELSSIKYYSDGLKVSGLLVQPKKPGKYPCIIYNRGGNRSFGSLNVAKGLWLLGKLANEGYVVIASNYRGGTDEAEGMEEFGGKDVNDVLNLIKVLEELENADAENIGMYGWSRGGMMTFIALTKTDRIKAAVTGGAKSDMTIIDRPNMESNVYRELIPNYDENKEEELKKRSAIFWVDKFPKNVPILLLHGNADWRVKSTNSLKLALAFEEHRVPYRLKIFEGADHGIKEFRSEVDEEVIDWFRKYLKGEAALPDMAFHGK